MGDANKGPDMSLLGTVWTHCDYGTFKIVGYNYTSNEYELHDKWRNPLYQELKTLLGEYWKTGEYMARAPRQYRRG
jgi:hypothetical protein